MNSVASSIRQLERLQKVYMLRLRNAEKALFDARAELARLEKTRDDIQACADQLERDIQELGKAREQQLSITVHQLQDEIERRTILKKDLRKELFYLDTANSDVSEALVVVNDKRSQWLKHKSKLSGLEKLGDQYEAELEQLDTLRGNEELDELSASRYIEAQHG